VRADDRDAGENARVTYSIVDDDADVRRYFVIDASTGQVYARHGTGSQRPSDPGIQRPGDPVDPVTLFYNELQTST